MTTNTDRFNTGIPKQRSWQDIMSSSPMLPDKSELDKVESLYSGNIEAFRQDEDFNNLVDYFIRMCEAKNVFIDRKDAEEVVLSTMRPFPQTSSQEMEAIRESVETGTPYVPSAHTRALEIMKKTGRR